MTMDRGRPRRTPGLSGGAAVAFALGLSVGIIALPIAFYAIAFAIRGTPEHDGYVVQRLSCEVEPVTGYTLVELTLEQLSYSDDYLRIERPRAEGVELIGVTKLPYGSTLAGLDASGRSTLIEELEAGEEWIEIQTLPRTVVIALDRTSTETSALESVTVWWSPGEPAFVQHVPLDLRWSGSNCTLG